VNAAVRAISGPIRGAVFRLVEDEVTIGRQPSNHLCIGDVSVSRQQCVITFENGRHKVKDLNSRNGTLLNGVLIKESFLQCGDQLGIGDTVLEYLEDSAESSDTPLPVTDQETATKLRVRPLDETKRTQTAELAVISEIGQLLNSKQSGEVLDRLILDAISRFLGAEKSAVFLAWTGGWILCGPDKQANPEDYESKRQAVIDRALRGGTVVAETIDNANAALAVPLFIRGAMAGAIYFERSGALRSFTPQEAASAATLSNYLGVSLDYSQNVPRLEADNRRMREQLQLRHTMVGESKPMQEVYKRIGRIAPTDATVLIRGETGTGKELAARAIHDNSPRAERAFEAINCALLKGDLLESELFGHEKGAFTGAVTQKKGKLEVANGGTVFLDEVAELPEGPQAMLLRVLQEHAFERLGGTKRIEVDIRIIAATNKDLNDAVKNHAFRRDLFYRLNVVSVHMPSLRERRDDIRLLVQHFIQRTSKKNNRLVTGISREALAYLQAYDWPGNVRELENAIEHAIVFGSTEQIMPEDLPDAILQRTPKTAVPSSNYQEMVKNAKREIVLNALQAAKGDHAKAAKLLNVHPNNLYRLMRDLDVKLQPGAWE
jgi:DNA-binding NtrC family response regulator/pSer/pThr/pTyr-binding forkhead associated (FHA) protein